ncbi:MAG: Zn-dependent protease [Myxococcales bacterium]|nr:Zn-dependent protease [Myxococcales bacterium]
MIDAVQVDEGDDPVPAPMEAPPLAFADPVQEQNFLAAQAQFVSPPRVTAKTRMLLTSLVMFGAITMMQGGSSIIDMAVLVGVLMVHELGHALAMLVFGYTDVRVFFIPFFGAATSGHRRGVARWKQGVVLMFGPLPGLVIGSVLLWRGVSDGLAHTIAMQLIVINAFNLLPIAPFDGGQLFQLILFSRHRHVELGFLTVASLAMFGLAVLLSSWVFGVIGVFMLISLPVRKKVLAAADVLREQHLPEDTRALDEPQRRRLFDAVWRLMPETWRGKPVPQASTMEQIHASATQRPLSVAASAGVGLLWIAGVALSLAAVIAFVSGPPARWQRYYDANRTFSIELPTEPTESTEQLHRLHATRGRAHDYDVMWSSPVLDTAAWVAQIETALTAKGTRLRDLAIPDSEAAYVVKIEEAVTMIRIVVKDGTGYIIMGSATSDDQDSERVIRSFRVEPH